MPKKVFIVGTGLGGISTALRLTQRGYTVEMVEQFHQTKLFVIVVTHQKYQYVVHLAQGPYHTDGSQAPQTAVIISVLLVERQTLLIIRQQV